MGKQLCNGKDCWNPAETRGFCPQCLEKWKEGKITLQGNPVDPENQSKARGRAQALLEKDAKRARNPLLKEARSFRVVLDFSGDADLFEKIVQAASKNRRSVESECLCGLERVACVTA